ncbi:MAG: type I-C CRISPR-associated endonuclease Cas1c [Clostridiales bacterium]|jgi:CRISPR-associated protein Cas1|nr:type I-C CRISPR-associated endonuclease Cas1c [Clostridiales bacterium]
MKKLLNVLYITLPDAAISLEDENVCVKKDGAVLLKVPLLTLEGIVSFSYFGATSKLMCECARRNITLSFVDEYGRFLGTVYGESKGNVLLRKEQYRISDDARGLEYAKSFVFGKLHNQKWVVERAIRDYPLRVDGVKLKAASVQITENMRELLSCPDMGLLRAAEGNAAQSYFRVFDGLVLQNKDCFLFENRNRRPPLDPINALLSFAYSLLAGECRHALEAVGLDAYVGFMHADRPGRASLALDLMEELRPQYADRFVLSLINRKEILPDDFERSEAGAVLLTKEARKKFLSAWQQRKKDEIKHPFLNEKLEWGLIPHVQALLLARTIRGDLERYPPFLWK